MYAVIKTGGKQYKVAVGDKIKIELIPADINSTVTFSEILMLTDGENTTVGTPFVSGATVSASIINQGRHKKIRIFKMRRRKHYQKHQGHRQYYTEVKIDAINK